MLKIYQKKPVFGVETNIQELKKFKEEVKEDEEFTEDIEIVETEYNETNDDAMNQYLTAVDSEEKEIREIIFSKELGLAIEKPPNGVSVSQLWKIISK